MLITQKLVSSSKYSVKCPYAMTPQGITIHNTANDASAANEVAYMIRNNYQTSFHYAVDDYQAVQGIPENRNAWHASDGHGFGNMKTIAIEICYSKSGGDRFHKAEENAAELVAILMKKYGWGADQLGTKVINTHKYRSGKYCPHRTLDEGIDRFWNMVREKLGVATGSTNVNPVQNNTGARKVGDVVTINGIYTSSTSTNKLNPARNSGTITKIVNARNPYLLDNGNLGWTNDSCITSGSTASSQPSAPARKSVDELAQEVLAGKWGTGNDRKSRLESAGYNYSEVQNRVNQLCGVKTSSKPATSTSSNIVKGSRVKVRQGAKDYNGRGLASSVYSRTYDVIQVNGNRVVIGIGTAVTAAVNKNDVYRV